MPDLRPSIDHQILRVVNRIKTRGPAEVARLLTGRLKEAWGSEETLILLMRDAAHLERDAPGLTFRRAVPADGPRYARDVGTDSATTFAARLKEDVMCFIVEDGEQILHASWVTTSAAWTREIQTLLRPPLGDAYVYESFTRTDARGRGIYPFALAGMVTHLAETGVMRVWVGVEGANTPSRRAIAKAGFEEAFQVSYSRRKGRLKVDPPTGPLADSGRTFLFGG